jgi:hypothetical protein
MKLYEIDVTIPGPVASSKDEAKSWLAGVHDGSVIIELANLPGSIATDEDGNEFDLSKIVEAADTFIYNRTILVVDDKYIPLISMIATITTSDIDQDGVSDALRTIAGTDDANRAQAIEKLVPLLTEDGKEEVRRIAQKNSIITYTAQSVQEVLDRNNASGGES